MLPLVQISGISCLLPAQTMWPHSIRLQELYTPFKEPLHPTRLVEQSTIRRCSSMGLCSSTPGINIILFLPVFYLCGNTPYLYPMTMPTTLTWGTTQYLRWAILQGVTTML